MTSDLRARSLRQPGWTEWPRPAPDKGSIFPTEGNNTFPEPRGDTWNNNPPLLLSSQNIWKGCTSFFSPSSIFFHSAGTRQRQIQPIRSRSDSKEARSEVKCSLNFPVTERADWRERGWRKEGTGNDFNRTQPVPLNTHTHTQREDWKLMSPYFLQTHHMNVTLRLRLLKHWNYECVQPKIQGQGAYCTNPARLDMGTETIFLFAWGQVCVDLINNTGSSEITAASPALCCLSAAVLKGLQGECYTAVYLLMHTYRFVGQDC